LGEEKMKTEKRPAVFSSSWLKRGGGGGAAREDAEKNKGECFNGVAGEKGSAFFKLLEERTKKRHIWITVKKRRKKRPAGRWYRRGVLLGLLAGEAH